ncbi:hypothetical protein KAFR_0A06080 [Kazachstania africana CBS 2517]|uniref:HTH APSES-type domain-containing protein n=1 Tax=Kazachstania africana (strain ATCC 22294 / BCRC 22015 / CBS 2517 / CECT 1963 / NBRC 1671 / NRRL Y-8276) TaxID=1071382 RepID=H2ANU3_KAZAF|nr:hypothetical protein KAFR_0A06080 [Kazachstania africana CBS 2517]CCF56043.1 hypothetical protein KAFR_0A06080 [Kazachstania africana CBS 2517]
MVDIDAVIKVGKYSNIDVYELLHPVAGSIMKRRIDNWVNATHVLKIANFNKSKRLRLLEKEVIKAGKAYEKIQGGSGKYQGTWVPLEVAKELAVKFEVINDLLPLLEFVHVETTLHDVENNHAGTECGNSLETISKRDTVSELKISSQRQISVANNIQFPSSITTDQNGHITENSIKFKIRQILNILKEGRKFTDTKRLYGIMEQIEYNLMKGKSINTITTDQLNGLKSRRDKLMSRYKNKIEFNQWNKLLLMANSETQKNLKYEDSLNERLKKCVLLTYLQFARRRRVDEIVIAKTSNNRICDSK